MYLRTNTCGGVLYELSNNEYIEASKHKVTYSSYGIYVFPEKPRHICGVYFLQQRKCPGQLFAAHAQTDTPDGARVYPQAGYTG